VNPVQVYDVKSSLVIILYGSPFIALIIALNVNVRRSGRRNLRLLTISAFLPFVPFICLSLIRFSHAFVHYEPGGPMLLVVFVAPIVFAVSLLIAIVFLRTNARAPSCKWAISTIVLDLVYIGLALWGLSRITM